MVLVSVCVRGDAAWLQELRSCAQTSNSFECHLNAAKIILILHTGPAAVVACFRVDSFHAEAVDQISPLPGFTSHMRRMTEPGGPQSACHILKIRCCHTQILAAEILHNAVFRQGFGENLYIFGAVAPGTSWLSCNAPSRAAARRYVCTRHKYDMTGE